MQAQCRLTSAKVVIRGYLGEGKGPALPLLGKFDAALRKGGKQRADTVYVIKGQGDVALLSRQAAEDMGHVEYHIEATTAMAPPCMGENRQKVVDIIFFTTFIDHSKEKITKQVFFF